MRKGFTLIEVMVAVMIISVVIMALLQMYANSNHIFSVFKEKTKTNQYSSFFISNQAYGLENKSIHMDELVSDFKVEDDLRRNLKDMKAEVLYQVVGQIDMSESDDATEEGSDTSSNMILELGKTILKVDNSSNALLRIRIQ